MNKLNDYLQEIICDTEKKKQYANSPKDFTRNRDLPFSYLVMFLINLLKRSLSVELQDFFSHTGRASITKSAFCQQRKKLKAEFFKDWNQVLVSAFYDCARTRVRKWRGFVLLAIDGTTLSLPNTKVLRETYGYSSNQHKTESATARASILYDVLNKIVVKSSLCSFYESERTTACGLVSCMGQNDLLLLDRGYPSFMLFYMLSHKQDCKFVMRAKANFNEIAGKFYSSDETDKTVFLSATYKGIKRLKDEGIIIEADTMVKVRMVKVRLDSGEEELLITNLYDENIYSLSDLKDLYFLRWGVEVAYGLIKNELQIESFSGINPICIEQDFYANIFVFNIQCIVEKQCDDYLTAINKHRKVSYKVNKNISWAMLKGKIVDLFLKRYKTKKILLELKILFEKHLEPVRPGRKYHRIIKSIKLNGKYVTHTNYKRAI